ncbi:hypothetical protein Syun_027516 [Stephania yunnanensis]|uniref:Uncharacterized protein n=1 Tax=Stephania yunnanensis TaxID=152371 RepID=A0AAP0EFR0_9MAGN
MRMLCDVCESAAAILFYAADEASLCRACDHKIIDRLVLFECFVMVGIENLNVSVDDRFLGLD